MAISVNKRILFKLLVAAVLSVLISIISAVYYAYSLIQEANLDIVFTTETEGQLDQLKEIVFEEGATFRLDDFQEFFVFTESSETLKEWLKNKYVEKDIFPINDNEYLVTKKISISSLINNHCQENFCYQHRISFTNIPANFWKGLIGIEDYRYLSHKGVDYKSILRALVADIRAMKLVQGGSTLTQQLVKNLFLTNEKSLSRKIKEMIYSLYIESKFSKEEILTAYLNEVYWGTIQGINVKGLYAACVFYFGKSPKELSSYEVAILIGLLKGPGYYNPFNRLDRLKSRVRVVSKKLDELNLFPGGEESIEWSEKNWKSWAGKLSDYQKTRPYKNIWELKRLDSTYLNDFEKFIFLKAKNATYNRIKKKYPDADLAIKAIIGPTQCEKNCQLFSYYSKFERSKEKAIKEEAHQVGSIFKPIIYSIFLQHGKGLEDMVSTEKITLKLKSGEWSPNDSGQKLAPEIPLKEALLKSKNRPLIRVANEIGFDAIEKSLKPYLPEMKVPLGQYPAQLIGSVELPLGRIFEIYTEFIKNECHKKSALIPDEEENKDSPELLTKSDENIIVLLSDPRQTTVQRVVNERFKALNFFGKTGTTNEGVDNWFVAFDGLELSIIWVGIETNKNSQKWRLSGATTAFKIYQSFVNGRGKRFSELTCGSES